MPDVFVIGFTKCASTTFYEYLQQHPDTANVRNKEPHYHFAKAMGTDFRGVADQDTISQMFICSKQAYLKMYSVSGLTVDASVMSIHSKKAIELMKNEYPNAFFIILLRDPIQRAFSAYSHMVRDVRESLTFTDAIRDELVGNRLKYLPIWSYLTCSKYVELVHFSREKLGEKLMLVRYEDLIKFPEKTMESVFLHVGLTNFAIDPVAKNISGTPKLKWVQKAMKRKSIFKSAFKSAVPRKFTDKIKESIFEWNLSSKPIMTNEDSELIRRHLIEEKLMIIGNRPDDKVLESVYKCV